MSAAPVLPVAVAVGGWDGGEAAGETLPGKSRRGLRRVRLTDSRQVVKSGRLLRDTACACRMEEASVAAAQEAAEAEEMEEEEEAASPTPSCSCCCASSCA